MPSLQWALACLFLLSVSALRADEAPPAWGTITPGPSGLDLFTFTIRDWPKNGALNVPTPFANIVRATTDAADGHRPIDFEFNPTATELKLHLPERRSPDAAQPQLIVQTAEKSRQLPNGSILFSALDAVVKGTAAKLESHPGNHRIGFWSQATDFVTWSYNASRPGKYHAFLTYSSASPSGAKIDVLVGPESGESKSASAVLVSTGNWYRYTTLDVGPVQIATPGKHTIAVKCAEPKGGAVMNLKSVVLVPACEGSPPKQASDGVILLHARDATVNGVTLRWEPDPKKQTLGFWVRASDAASWKFTVDQPGEFEVEVLQGCGAGQGGSPMKVALGESILSFTVEDTGHFQNFKPRIIGKVNLPAKGDFTLSVQPEKIAKSAACDIRQIRLAPVKK